MNIKNDEIRISTINFNEKGDKLEPEEQAAARIITADSPMMHGQGLSGKVVGAIPTQIIADTTAGEMAQTLRHQCRSCKHFDHENWVKILRTKNLSEIRSDHEQLNNLRARLLQTQNASLTEMHTAVDGDIDIEHAMASLGLCRALTETLQDAVIVHPLGSCPDEVITVSSPHGLYQSKDEQAAKEAASLYDLILRKTTNL